MRASGNEFAGSDLIRGDHLAELVLGIWAMIRVVAVQEVFGHLG
jgi:hypothetical protein